MAHVTAHKYYNSRLGLLRYLGFRNNRVSCPWSWKLRQQFQLQVQETREITGLDSKVLLHFFQNLTSVGPVLVVTETARIW